MPTITPLPTPPSRADSANFSDRADSFLGALPTLVSEVNAVNDDLVTKHGDVVTKHGEALTAAQNAVNAPGTSGTSTTSIAIGTGSKTFTTQTAKSFVVGMKVIAAVTASPQTNWIYGTITAYNSGTGSITINAESAMGSGTFAAWTISLTGPFRVEARGALVTKNSTTQSIPNTTETAILFDTSFYNTESVHNGVSNTSRLTVPANVSKIKLFAQVTFAANATGFRMAYIRKNGSSATTFSGQPKDGRIASPATFATAMSLASPLVQVVPGDYFELVVQQTSGGALDVQLNNLTWFAMEIVA